MTTQHLGGLSGNWVVRSIKTYGRYNEWNSVGGGIIINIYFVSVNIEPFATN